MYETQVYPQSQTRHSHAGLWVTIGIMAGIAVISLLLAGAVFLGLNQVKENGPTPARFYMALHDQNYALAYSYLDSGASLNNQPVDQQSFIGQFAQADSRTKAISGFEITNKNDASNATVKVSRAGASYEVHLQMKQVDGRWLITSIDRV